MSASNDTFAAAQEQGTAIDELLVAFEEWGMEGYYDAEDQKRINDDRTRCLQELDRARKAVLKDSEQYA